MASNKSKQGRRPAKPSSFWLDLINAALRDVLPERLQVRVLPSTKKRAKAQKRPTGEGEH